MDNGMSNRQRAALKLLAPKVEVEISFGEDEKKPKPCKDGKCGKCKKCEDEQED